MGYAELVILRSKGQDPVLRLRLSLNGARVLAEGLFHVFKLTCVAGRVSTLHGNSMASSGCPLAYATKNPLRRPLKGF